MKRVPKELTNEEILKALENSDVELPQGMPEYRNDILAFLSFYGVTNGKEKIPCRLLYKIYREWSENPLTSKTFSEEIHQHIEFDKSYIYINLKSIDLSISAYKHLKSNSRNKTKSPAFRKHFDEFTSLHELKKGTKWIPSFVLYYLYDKWCYNSKKRPLLSEENFSRFLKLYFPIRKRARGTNYWYSVDKSIYNHITKEQVSIMIRTRKIYGKKRSKKTNEQEKENEIPQSGSNDESSDQNRGSE